VTAPHFFVDHREFERFAVGDRVALSKEDSRHALRSLRLREGEAVTVANNLGWVGRGRLAVDGADRAVAEIAEVSRQELATHPVLNVSLAPPKGDRLTWAVQKLAEIGTDAMMLVQTARTVRFPSDQGIERLKVVAREAAMQSRRPRIMAVHPGGPFELLFGTGGDSGADVVLTEAAGAPLSEVLPPEIGSIHLVVGPEGGLTDDELRVATGRGALLASLGTGTLRTETAAIVGAALALHRYGRLG
jgi:16S rRNA (uracil1498-N3)-methyltransferase